MKRIEKDIERMNKGGSFGALSKLGAGLFMKDHDHLGMRVLQFVINAAIGTVVSIVVIKTFFPNVFSEGKKDASAAGGAQPTNQE